MWVGQHSHYPVLKSRVLNMHPSSTLQTEGDLCGCPTSLRLLRTQLMSLSALLKWCSETYCTVSNQWECPVMAGWAALQPNESLFPNSEFIATSNWSLQDLVQDSFYSAVSKYHKHNRKHCTLQSQYNGRIKMSGNNDITRNITRDISKKAKMEEWFKKIVLSLCRQTFSK